MKNILKDSDKEFALFFIAIGVFLTLIAQGIYYSVVAFFTK